ncbi:ATP-binding cassette domain-containing protein [Streptomyces tsukubensis]
MSDARTTAPPHPSPSPSSRRSGRFGRADRVLIAVLVLCTTAGALAAVALPAVLGRTLDRVVTGGEVPWAGLALCAALTAADAGLDALVALLGGTSTAARTARLRTEVLDRLLRAAPRDAGALPPGDLTTRVTANAADAASVPVTAAAAVPGALLPLGAAVALLLIDPWTGLALIAGLPAAVLLLRVLLRRSADAAADYQREQALVATRLTEALDGIATVRAAGTAAREHTRITEPLGRLAAHGRRTWRIQGTATGQAAVLMPLLTVVVLAVAGTRLAAGAITVGDLLAVSRYAVLALGLGALTGTLGALARGRAAAARLDPLLALAPVPHRSLVLPPGGPGTLELRDVGVVRDGRTLLEGITLTVPGGTSAAVVGRSGAGKSLLAAVAGRLTDPDTGTVAVDGVPLDGADPIRLRHDIGYAFARPALLGTTVEDAVALGPDRPGPGAVDTALRDASADGFVALLPAGARTPLAGAPLSGGEYQRLGLARAFVRDARLLVLDDATSSLDTVTEARIQHALARRAGTCTRLLVAHRAATAAAADQVVWLDGGRLRATGRHAELWRDPEYRAVFGTPDPTEPPDSTETPEAPELREPPEPPGPSSAQDAEDTRDDSHSLPAPSRALTAAEEPS